MGFTGMKTTYQYSVKEHVRPIDHDKGSHGTPGIYFKYDLSALKVEVTKDRFDCCLCVRDRKDLNNFLNSRLGLFQFLVRLCASVGGLVATSQIVCGLLKSLLEYLCCITDQSPTPPATASLLTN